MSNTFFAAVTLVVFAAHVAALTLGVRGRSGPMLALNATIALSVLVYLGARPQSFRFPLDGQLGALAAFELLVLVAAAFALKGGRGGVVLSWIAFGLQFVVSASAVAFALLFKMTRLI